jgi:triosephosphate isomerase (TIM)
MSRQVIAGNWKMNLGPAAAREFVTAFLPLVEGVDAEILLFPPTLSLASALGSAGDAPLHFGVQNVHWEGEGAFTGEISVAMAGEAGATHALAGHSERRQLFHETDAEVARKATAIRAGGLIPVVCVGETLEERRGGRLEEVLLRQLDAVLDTLEGGTGRWMLAYEPVWAIGTGETATPADAAEAHALLRHRLVERGGGEAAGVPILYGGSVKPGNAAELLGAPEVGGVLVGGASLDPDSFAAIARAARG